MTMSRALSSEAAVALMAAFCRTDCGHRYQGEVEGAHVRDADICKRAAKDEIAIVQHLC